MIGGGLAQPADGPLTCDVPRGPAGSLTPVTLLPPSGPSVPAGNVPVNETPPSPTSIGISVPPTCTSGDPLRIAWRFDGDGANTRVLVGGQPVRVITETPRGAVVQIPAGIPAGPVEIVVTEKGRSRRVRTAAIRVVTSADRPDLKRGQSTKVHVVVEGLSGIPDVAWLSGPDTAFLDRALLNRIAPGTRIPGPTEPGYIVLTIESASRDTIALGKDAGEVVRLLIRKRDISTTGTYTYHGEARALRDGRVEVKATIVPLIAPAAGEWVP
jgi:hypothetical protein